MKKYLAFLRGINVSGQKIIKMKELIFHLNELNLNNLTTYIQSGNILFGSENDDIEELTEKIRKKIKEKYTFDVPVITKSINELIEISENNPFLNQKKEGLEKLYVTLLAEKPKDELAQKFELISFKPDEFIINEKVLYGFVANGYGNTKFSNSFIESKLKITATTRSWKTLLKLIEISNSIA